MAPSTPPPSYPFPTLPCAAPLPTLPRLAVQLQPSRKMPPKSIRQRSASLPALPPLSGWFEERIRQRILIFGKYIFWTIYQQRPLIIHKLGFQGMWSGMSNIIAWIYPSDNIAHPCLWSLKLLTLQFEYSRRSNDVHPQYKKSEALKFFTTGITLVNS